LSEFFLYWRFTMLVSIVKVSDSFINLHIVICQTAVILLFSCLLLVTIAGFGVGFAVSLDWFWWKWRTHARSMVSCQTFTTNVQLFLGNLWFGSYFENVTIVIVYQAFTHMPWLRYACIELIPSFPSDWRK
jgi:hypothetical protein